MSTDHFDSVLNIRENLVATAIKFLTNPNVQRCTEESKQKFLRSKGLTDAEIQSAFEKITEGFSLPTVTSELMLYQHSRRSWFHKHVLPFIVYGGITYGIYWIYKNFIKKLIFTERPKKTSEDNNRELQRSMDTVVRELLAVRTELDTRTLHSQIDGLKADIASVKGILLNRNQFPALTSRAEPPSIPAWQRQSEQASSQTPDDAKTAEEVERGRPAGAARTRSQRSESGGSNSSEGEAATKNSDSSLEIIT